MRHPIRFPFAVLQSSLENHSSVLMIQTEQTRLNELDWTEWTRRNKLTNLHPSRLLRRSRSDLLDPLRIGSGLDSCWKSCGESCRESCRELLSGKAALRLIWITFTVVTVVIRVQSSSTLFGQANQTRSSAAVCASPERPFSLKVSG